MDKVRAAADETYLTVKQAADYLHLNEKKLYALIQEGRIPATRATGKWLFPRRLLDEWLLETSHGGALADRLILSGSDDPLLAYAVALLAIESGDTALIAYSPCGTRLGLAQLARRRANVAAIHWGPAETSAKQHAELIAAYPGHEEWVMVQLGLREQGIMVGSEAAASRPEDLLLRPRLRWAVRQTGAGTQRFLERFLEHRNGAGPQVVATANSERHAASLVRQGTADCAPGVRSAAAEFGLFFMPLGREAFDLVLPRPIFFRALFQRLLSTLGSPPVKAYASQLGGAMTCLRSAHCASQAAAARTNLFRQAARDDPRPGLGRNRPRSRAGASGCADPRRIPPPS